MWQSYAYPAGAGASRPFRGSPMLDATMDLRSNAAWAMVVPTSMGVRITPVNGQPVHTSDTFLLQAHQRRDQRGERRAPTSACP